MRLLEIQENGELKLVEHIGRIPPYAILSHTWGPDNEEVTFQDLISGSGKEKLGYRKILFCASQARKDKLQYFWIDTCSIDKSSSAELSEAINSMFRWYQDSARCYVYLADVSTCNGSRREEGNPRWKVAIRKSRWFTRGWTLQELIAPPSVEFFSREEERLGDKLSLERTLQEITRIPIAALRGKPLASFSVEARMAWAASRSTKREEDEAYSLLGIFDISMPLIYGEGRQKAMKRLRKETVQEWSGSDATEATMKEHEQEEQKLFKILQDPLRFEQLDARQMAIKDAHKETCAWLLEHPTYLDWVASAERSSHHGCLWIRGKPGAGKSTLMKFAMSQAWKSWYHCTTISFFFNARGDVEERSVIGTDQSLLLQLLESHPALQSIFRLLGHQQVAIENTRRWDLAPLQMLLSEAIQRLRNVPLACAIDAIDECEEAQVRNMIRFFESIADRAAEDNMDLRICFASRRYPHISIRKGLTLILDRQPGHDEDIARYIASELRTQGSSLAQDLWATLQAKSSGIFMWVVLAVGIINREYDRGRVHLLRRKLKGIPSNLHKLFHDILSRDSEDKEYQVLCIQWILFARYPLTPLELYYAILLGVEPDGVSSWNVSEISYDHIQKFILDSSKGLAEVVGPAARARVVFIHESVRDFLLKEKQLVRIWPELSNNFEGQSHERLKLCCKPCVGSHALPSIWDLTNLMAPGGCNPFSFLRYAVHNTLYHADVAQAHQVGQVAFLQDFPLSLYDSLRNSLGGLGTMDHTTLLYLLTEKNLASLIMALKPEASACFNYGNSRYGSPMFAALAAGSEEAVCAFVNVLTAQYPHRPVVRHEQGRVRYCTEIIRKKLFMDMGSPICGRGGLPPRYLLSYLTELGNGTLLGIALQMPSSAPDARDAEGKTPLLIAAEQGNTAIVEMLLSMGNVDINSQDLDAKTPINWAASNGHVGVVKLLLDNDADVELRDNADNTAFYRAVVAGHTRVMKLLLETGKVNVNHSPGRTNNPPLSYAVRFALAHTEVVKILLDTGSVDVDYRDRNGRTPLHHAVEMNHEEIVRLLLEIGDANVDAKDRNGISPMEVAKRWRLDNILELLKPYSKV